MYMLFFGFFRSDFLKFNDSGKDELNGQEKIFPNLSIIVALV